MSRKVHCPECGSNRMVIHIPETAIWSCKKCGYIGRVSIEDGNLEKQIKEIKKMEKLNRKLLWRR